MTVNISLPAQDLRFIYIKKERSRERDQEKKKEIKRKFYKLIYFQYADGQVARNVYNVLVLLECPVNMLLQFQAVPVSSLHHYINITVNPQRQVLH